MKRDELDLLVPQEVKDLWNKFNEDLVKLYADSNYFLTGSRIRDIEDRSHCVYINFSCTSGDIIFAEHTCLINKGNSRILPKEVYVNKIESKSNWAKEE